MITIEYKGKVAEVALNIWNDFLAEHGDNLDFLGDECDIVLDEAAYNKLLAVVEKSASHLGAGIIKKILYFSVPMK